MNRSCSRQVGADGDPAAAPVVALQHIRLEIVTLVIVESGVDNVSIELVGKDITYVGILGYSRECLYHPPVLAAVFRNRYLSVITAGIYQVLLYLRFGQ